jgi:hypothetical protein
MPPQQGDGLLNVFDGADDFRAHDGCLSEERGHINKYHPYPR